MTAPDPPGLRRVLEEVWTEVAPLEGGACADYIPELSGVDPRLFGLAVCDASGEVTGQGDLDVPFTLQSVSKPFLYGLALDRFGVEAVDARVGVEPTGDAFDAIVRLDESHRRPHNPMVNAGAIAITGLFVQRGADAVEELLGRLGAFCEGKALAVDVPVYLSERGTAHRNRAIAHLLRYFRVLDQPVEETLDLYFHQCSALVSVRQLAVMAATLAGGGRNPRTGEQVLSPEAAGRVLAVLSTCGLYDASGRFLFDVGLPGKSGVSGGLLAVAPGRLGVAAFSPPLDDDGNSVRGIESLRRLSRRWSLHAFEPGSGSEAARPNPVSQAALEQARERARSVSGGAVAQYAPGLAEADPELFGLAVCTVDGVEFATGDVDRPFTLQSAVNPLAFAYVSGAVGTDAVLARCGVEPSGNPFHAILLDPRTNQPYNPLGNAGAMVVDALAPGRDGASRLKGLLGFLAELAGETTLPVDAAMLAAERSAGERNRAIASLLCWAGWIDDREAALELYLQQCCVVADARRLARMAATLANGGRQPGTGRTVLSPASVRETLSLMYTSGHHDESGSVAVDIGLPAKSGISGGILAVSPGRMGIAAWSPAVNAHGTSVRGRASLVELSRILGLGMFRFPPAPDAGA